MTRRRTRDEAGYVALVVAILFSSVMLGLAAIGVDVARWYVEAERVQTAADAAALAGVVYLPDNMPKAVETARESAELNGYRHGVNAEVTVAYGERRSQLDVTISTEVDNQFGAAIGVDTATIGRRAAADYTSPAPMGSPCNTFGNEPPGGSSTAGPAGSVIPVAYTDVCTSNPQFWAAIEGPQTNKQQGDRYSTTTCTGTYGCNAAGLNTEAVHPEGYFFAIKVGAAAVGSPVTVQLYDPAYYNTGATCATMPSRPPDNDINAFTTADARNRYNVGASVYCSGDLNPGSSSTSNPVTTSFALRSANDAQDPLAGAPVTGCTAQFRGIHSVPSLGNLTHNSSSTDTNYTRTPQTSYNPDTAKTFHQWYPLCTFTPTRSGDHYLQVRTNVALAGTTDPNNGRPPIVYRGNTAVTAARGDTTAGLGANSFAIRAVSTAHAAQLSVSGWSRMPMLQNTPDSTATFNLLRVLPAAAGQSISFEFFDVADGASDTGTVTVRPPRDATGSVTAGLTGCSGAINDADFRALSGCAAPIANATHNGQVQRMSIPIPVDYDCDDTKLTGCWFRVEIRQNGDITDFTTWDAALEGDPVRLIE